MARFEEFDIISRIIADIESDLRFFEFQLKAIDAKEDSLGRVRSSLVNGPTHDSYVFLRDIIVGADFGWNQGFAHRATFDDLLGSGRLHVIADPNIRTQIARYYHYYADSNNRINERETAYPGLSYQLVPRGSSSNGESVPWERDVEAGLSDEYQNELVRSILESSIADHVIAELNLARFMRGTTKDLQNQATSLVSRLEAYQTEIE